MGLSVSRGVDGEVERPAERAAAGDVASANGGVPLVAAANRP